MGPNVVHGEALTSNQVAIIRDFLGIWLKVTATYCVSADLPIILKKYIGMQRKSLIDVGRYFSSSHLSICSIKYIRILHPILISPYFLAS